MSLKNCALYLLLLILICHIFGCPKAELVRVIHIYEVGILIAFLIEACLDRSIRRSIDRA